MAILADFSPFLETMGLDEAYLNATGLESLHGSVRQMALEPLSGRKEIRKGGSQRASGKWMTCAGRPKSNRPAGKAR